MSEGLSIHQNRRVHYRVRDLLFHNYFDVRIEIVDHLAAHMENRMRQDSQLSFIQAFNEAVDSFGGIKGIRKLERSKKWEARKEYITAHLKAVQDAFRFPQIVITLALFSLIYLFISSINNGEVFFWMMIVAAGVFHITEYLATRKIKKWISATGNTFTSFDIYKKCTWVTNGPMMVLFTFWLNIDPVWWHGLFAAVLITIYIVFFILKYHILKKGVHEHLSQYELMHYNLMIKPYE